MPLGKGIWSDFKCKRNFVNRLTVSLNWKACNENEVENSSNDPKKLWKKIKELIPNQCTSKISDMTLNNGTVISENEKISNHFNEFFVNIGAKLASKFSTTDTSKINVTDPLNTFNFTPFSSWCYKNT